MKDKLITRKISHGVYVLTTKDAGCVVDAVCKISASSYPLISVSVNKKNNTNEALKINDKFALSVLGKSVNPEIIDVFGMHSMRDYDKFSKIETEDINGIKVIKDSLGYMLCEIVDIIDAETHDLFIGRLIEADKFSDEEEMTYNYYQEHKEELLKVKTEVGNTAFVCSVCGYVYYGEELPEDFKCPVCGVDKKLFNKK